MRKTTWIAVLVALLASGPASAQSWKSLLEKATGSQKSEKKTEEPAADITEEEASHGLKEALEIGANKAVELASARDGFLGNEKIRIPLPKSLRSLGDTLRRFGLGDTVDRFDLSMNRAAEAATAKARPILVDAVNGLTIGDAIAILKGGDTAATDLLRSRTEEQLTKEFKPIVTGAMDEAEVTRYYDQLMKKGDPLLGMLGQEQVDLDDYVTGKTLDGLFKLIAQQEQEIRKDPVARTTDLLKQVFGSLSK